VGSDTVISFDYDWYSNPLLEDTDPNHDVTYETIDGFRAKIVVPKVMGSGTTGVHFESLGGYDKLTLSTKDLSPIVQDIALKIFRTIEF